MKHTQKITDSGDFEGAAKNKTALNAYKRVISLAPDIDREARKILCALLDQTEWLTKDVLINFKKHPEIGDRVHYALMEINYGDNCGAIHDFIQTKNVNGCLESGLFTGNPPKTHDPEDYDQRKKPFPVIWFTKDREKNMLQPSDDAKRINFEKLDHKNVKLTKDIIRNDTTFWDRVKRDFE